MAHSNASWRFIAIALIRREQYKTDMGRYGSGQFVHEKERSMKISGTKITVVFATIAIVGLALLSGTSAHAQAPSGYTLSWSDEFNGAVGSAPNSANWVYNTGAGGWGNDELETYVNSNANCHIISDTTGTDSLALQIEAQTNSSGQWYSARITTLGKKSVGPYGYMEIRAKYPTAGQGYWPAGWMLGTDYPTAGWPECGEIDIAEEVNSQNINHGSLHAPSNWNPTAQVNVSNATTTYNNYGALWTSTAITFYLNGTAYETCSKSSAPSGGWVFTSTDYFLLNLAIGGSFPGNPNSSTKDDGNFDIDYVRYYVN